MNLLDALSGIGTVLDTPGAMLRTGLAGENPFAAVFDTDKRVSGRDLLERYGLAGENTDQGWIPDMGDLGGFAAEMLLDPTNLIGGGLLARLMGKAGKAKVANKLIREGTSLPPVKDIDVPYWKLKREQAVNGLSEMEPSMFEDMLYRVKRDGPKGITKTWMHPKSIKEGYENLVARDLNGRPLAMSQSSPTGIEGFARDKEAGLASQRAAMDLLQELNKKPLTVYAGQLTNDSASLLHRIYVDEAVRRGKDVPAEVLADYPKAGKSKYLQRAIPVDPLQRISSPNPLLAALLGENAASRPDWEGLQ